MLILSSLFALLLRISLLCQGQVEGITDSVQLDFFENQTAQAEEGHLQQAQLSIEGLGSLVPSIEIEERSEVESEKSPTDFALSSVASCSGRGFLKVCPLFSNKAIRGSRLPLYDFFHSWKIHLS
ncbi:MAG: hypothetical protein FJX97_08705 [Bacteroidetes bacterium]|nr:hypothetical protein [Bacteroidota bacterium]